MSYLSIYQRERIIHFWEEGMNVSEIMRAMEEEGRITSRTTVRKWIFHWSSGRGLQDQHCCGAKSKITTKIAAYLEKKTEEAQSIA